MNWSKRNQWIMGVALVCVIGLVVPQLFHSAKSVGAESGEQWRAESDTLVQRVEKLAVAGEMDAAASVLEVVLQRGDLLATGQGDRARMALARAYLAGGRRDQALAQVMAIPWADKGPQIAAEIVGMELAVRWRGLFDDQLDLVSGALTPQKIVVKRRSVVLMVCGKIAGYNIALLQVRSIAVHAWLRRKVVR